MLWIIMDIENEADRSLVEEIYIKYERQMYYISFKILNDKYDAQDCVHETIAKIIDYLDKFKAAREKGYLERLIAIACRNCALNMYNKKRHRRKHEIPITSSTDEIGAYNINEIPDDSARVDKIIISEHNHKLLRDLIDRLDLKYKDVIMLKSMGFNYTQIGEIMGISTELARKRMSRARSEIIKMGGDALDCEQ